MLLAHADGGHGREALAALDFYAHADLFMTPTAELADLVLPVASAFEREALKIGFEISEEAQSLIQLRPAVVPPPGEARPDTDIVFDLAGRLGLGEQFWDGDIDAAYRHQLAPTGVTLEQLRAAPGGVRVPLQTRHAKHAERGCERRAARLRNAVAQGRALFADLSRSRLPAVAGFRGAADRPDGAARSRGALSADPDQREADACSARPSIARCRACASARLHPEVRAASRGGAGARHRRWRLGRDRDAGGQRARPRALQRQTSIRAWWSASMAGGRPARRSAPPATTRSDRMAPTST